MKIGLFILIFLFGHPLVDQDKRYVSFHTSEVSFSDFAKSIYEQTGVKVFYAEESVKNLKVTLDVDSISIEDALKIVLKGTGIEVSKWNNNYILIPGEKLITSLPEYNLGVDKDSSTKQTFKPTEAETNYIKTRSANTTQVYRIGYNNSGEGNAIILGKVIDQEKKTPILNATIIVDENGKGSITDINGSFVLNVKPGKYNTKVECLGYEKKKVFLEVLSGGEVVFELKKRDILIDELLVFGDRQNSIKYKEPGVELLTTKSIKPIPMMMGERDILKISCMLPGIVSVGEGSSGLNVRGGSSDQNIFYIEKIPIYNTSHLFGFFPAFNSDIIKEFSIYKGHIPAEYGGRVSSVFNIVSRQSNPNHFTAHGGINPVTGYVTVESPIIKETLSMIFSARTSYSDWILSRIRDTTIRNSSSAFNDFCGSLNYHRNKTQVSLFVYNSNDHFRLSGINEYQYSNLGSSLNLKYNFNTTFKGELTAISSEYTFKTIDNQDASSAYKHNYKIGHYEFRSDFNKTIGTKTALDYGTSVIIYKLDRGFVVPYGNLSFTSPVNLGKEQGVESAIYISDKYDVLPRLTLSLGFRFTLYAPLGPKSVYTYESGYPQKVEYITDTIKFKKNEPIKWFKSPEIRASVNFQTDNNGSIKLAYNQMQQNMFMLSNTISMAPNTQWKLADYHIKPSRSEQISLGVFRNIPNAGLETSLEFYIKKINNYTEFKDGANFRIPEVETAILQGVQKAYGVEFFIKRSGYKLDGWISYTYSRSKVQVTGANWWNQINYGKVYPSNYDIPHVVNALINYHFTRRIILSTVTTYQTGKPVTYPVSIYYYNGIQQIEYSERNKYRIPDYFRMDISLTVEGNLKKYKFVHSSVLFSIYNLTGRKNAYSVYYKLNGNKINCYKYSVIGVPLFTITWLFKLGNYEAI